MTHPTPPADIDELLATVARMEARLFTHLDPQVRNLMAVYRQLVPRFEADLSASERDIALAKSSALMLVQAVAEAQVDE